MMIHERMFIRFLFTKVNAPGEIFVVDGVRNLDSGYINLGGCSNQVSLVDPINKIIKF